MRIEEDIERSGYFWLPGNDEYKAPGTLRICDGGNISLEIVGSFSGPTGSTNDVHENTSIGRIIGHVEKAGLVTLERCIFTKRPYAFGGIVRSQIIVNWAVLGVAFDPDEEILFDTFTASIENLDEWLAVSGISSELDDEFKSFSIHYKRPDDLTLIDKDGLSINVQFSHNVPFGTEVSNAVVKQRAFLRASTSEPRKPEYFMSVFGRLRDFLSFAVDETVSLHSVSATNSSINVKIGEGKSKPAEMNVYYGATNHVDASPKINLHRALFRYGNISENLESIISSWISLYDKIAPSLNLYFATRAGAHKYLDSRFLALAQALETLHRRTSTETVMLPTEFDELLDILVGACPQEQSEWLKQRLAYGNEISLARRVACLLEPFSRHFGTKTERKRLVRLITNTRNYFTHYDQELSSKAATGRDLWVVSEKMEALLQLHLLRILEFTDEQIAMICSGPQALNQKLRLKFDEQ